MKYFIQPELDLNRLANAAGNEIGTNFVCCGELRAEHFAVYKSLDGSFASWELTEDFPDRWSASAYVALRKIRDIDNNLNDPKGDGSGEGAQAPTGDDYNDVLALVLDLLKKKEQPNVDAA